VALLTAVQSNTELKIRLTETRNFTLMGVLQLTRAAKSLKQSSL
jgi:hypothetical protein